MTNQIELLLPKIAQKAEHIAQQSQRLVLFCSGGLDSTVLSHVFCEKLKLQKYLTIELAHVNFMLRGLDSEQDENFVRILADRWGVAVQVTRVEHPESGATRVQEWARGVRQGLIREVELKGDVAVLAHHSDDVAETALFRLARGSSAGTLRGMEPIRAGVWRPLLGVPKAALAEYAQAEMIHHRHDASNDKLIYSRNQIRLEILPKLEKLFVGAAGRISDCVHDAADVQNALLSFLRQERRNNSDALGCLNTWIAEKTDGVALLAIADMINEQKQATVALSREILLKILGKLRDNSQDWELHLPSGLAWKSGEQRSRVEVRRSKQKLVRTAQHQAFFTKQRFSALIPGQSRITVQRLHQSDTGTRIEFINLNDKPQLQTLTC